MSTIGKSLAAASMLCLSMMAAVSHAESALTVKDAYVRAPIPGKQITAAFMSISNSGQGSDKLVSASAPWAQKIELHTHMHENGTMKMRQVDSIGVNAGTTTTLQPGGLHLMIFGLAQPLPATVGGQLPLELCFAAAGCQQVSATLVDMRM
ncbi:copper chaperone PCu(A)C [Oceanobacter mangrovi]|uniref:copper chaperone PCu(A)C n=1 Tax=Oceanobacter mangrovi TaxID=2862510 RepID=UPI001C8EF972|nr:copper chaperone PCu(A)C [Oceanobacter mangrovi]